MAHRCAPATGSRRSTAAWSTTTAGPTLKAEAATAPAPPTARQSGRTAPSPLRCPRGLRFSGSSSSLNPFTGDLAHSQASTRLSSAIPSRVITADFDTGPSGRTGMPNLSRQGEPAARPTGSPIVWPALTATERKIGMDKSNTAVLGAREAVLDATRHTTGAQPHTEHEPRAPRCTAGYALGASAPGDWCQRMAARRGA